MKQTMAHTSLSCGRSEKVGYTALERVTAAQQVSQANLAFDIHVHADRRGRIRASFTLPNGRRVGPFVLHESEFRALREVARLAGLRLSDTREGEAASSEEGAR